MMNTEQHTPAASAAPEAPFQARVQPWMMACFGAEIAADTAERNHRFLEESLELVQACGCTASEAHQLVDYVYGRPVGEPAQEVGGVMVTLGALCLAQGLDMHVAGEVELARVWTKVDAIRAKQAAKPKYSPLPAAAAPQVAADGRQAFEVWAMAEGLIQESNGIRSTNSMCDIALKSWKAGRADLAATSMQAQEPVAAVYPPDGTVSPFTVINLGHGLVKMGDSLHDGRLPALWFGTDGIGMGVSEEMNRAAKAGETLAVVTFANVEGLDVLSEVVQRIRSVAFPSAPAQTVAVPDDVAKLKHERDTLAQGIADAALKAGIWDGEVPLSGPHLLMMVNDMAGCIAAPVAQQDAIDAARIDFIENNTCYNDHDDDVYWNVIEHHMAAPIEREIGWGNTARQAIDAARATKEAS